MAKNAELETAKFKMIKVALLAKAYVNGRLYEAGETLEMLWSVNEPLPNHFKEVKEVKEAKKED